MKDQIQVTTSEGQYCKVCNSIFDNYVDHLKSQDHNDKYFGELDEEDGLPIVHKLDRIFNEMTTQVNLKL